MKDVLKASVSGIRGTVGGSLTPDVVLAWTGAFADWLGKGPVAVGRDSRKSGPLYQRLVESALMAAGLDIIDIGILPTPTLLAYVREKALPGGVLLTASHNPVQWNALKLVKAGGIFLDHDDFVAVRDGLSAERAYVAVDRIGQASRDAGAVRLHIDRLCGTFPVADAAEHGFHVAVDPVNGAGTAMDLPFLEALGCRVSAVNNEVTGDFSRCPEPEPEALDGLSRLVRQSGAVVGFAQDPDADRLVLVDEQGTPVSEELTLALCLLSWYGRGGRGDAVVNMSTSRINDDIASRFGFRVHRSKVGEANVLSRMRALDAPIGGEGNGGIILPELNPCRDSFVGMLLILDLLVREKRPLSAIIADLPRYTMVKKKFETAMPEDAATILKAAFTAAGEDDMTLNTDDGIRFDFSTGWIHVRESNTEPVVRIIGESADDTRLVRWIAAAGAALGVEVR